VKRLVLGVSKVDWTTTFDCAVKHQAPSEYRASQPRRPGGKRAHRLLYHSTLGSRVIEKKRSPGGRVVVSVVLLSAISAGT